MKKSSKGINCCKENKCYSHCEYFIHTIQGRLMARRCTEDTLEELTKILDHLKTKHSDMIESIKSMENIIHQLTGHLKQINISIAIVEKQTKRRLK